jgi:hypothetical protein
MEDVKCVFLKDGREIRLEDEDDISISITSGGESVSVFLVPYPSYGYSGGSLLLSPSEEYLLFAWYSGQSEESFTLFRISDKLEVVFDEAYSVGYACDVEGSYCFSKDERFLIQGITSGLHSTDDDWEDYVEHCSATDEDGKSFVEVGSINILDITQKVLCENVIRIYPSGGCFPEKFNPFLSPVLISESCLQITMPWGAETLELPLNGVIKFEF